jgi:hypothetical protein
VEDKKNFKRLGKVESFVLCMLMSLYHWIIERSRFALLTGRRPVFFGSL